MIDTVRAGLTDGLSGIVTVQVFIVHWLTMAPAEPEKSGGEGISWA